MISVVRVRYTGTTYCIQQKMHMNRLIFCNRKRMGRRGVGEKRENLKEEIHPLLSVKKRMGMKKKNLRKKNLKVKVIVVREIKNKKIKKGFRNDPFCKLNFFIFLFFNIVIC
mmetsp:Transcript_31695/g.30212  ORF Transcript_31695/g.30212 Transcript_31695/m.30212 type:complete len:112 (+) Transcript_31695:1063-1398(+)